MRPMSLRRSTAVVGRGRNRRSAWLESPSTAGRLGEPNAAPRATVVSGVAQLNRRSVFLSRAVGDRLLIPGP